MAYIGKLPQNRPGWDMPNGEQVATIRAGAYAFSNPYQGWASLVYNGHIVWTKIDFIDDYEPVPVTPTDPPVEPPPAEEIHPIRAVVDMSDGTQWETTQFVKV